MKKKIVLIRNAQPYDFGGGERFPTLLASELCLHGYTPFIISHSVALREFATKNNIKSINGPWWRMQTWSGVRSLLFPVYLVWQAILFAYYILTFIRINPQTVHIQSKDDFIAATLAAKSLRKKVIWTDHADLKHVWENLSVWHKNPIGKLVHLSAYFADYISVVSNSEKELVLNRLNGSVVSKKIHVIYNGAFDQYKPTKKNVNFTFISTGRLVVDKGISELIQAFAKLQTEFKNIHLQLVGDGPDREKFEKQAKNVKNVQFMGHRANPLQHLSSAQVFVLPTYHEGFSLALVEACMEATAIITTNVGGNPEIIIHRKTGLLVPTKSVDDLYTAMKELYTDNNLRETLGKNAREKYLAAFDFKKIINNEFLPLYKGDFS